MINQIILQRLDDNNLDPGLDEILLFACVRNENLRLPYFLTYYRRLGITRFIIVDNYSTDGTANYLLTQPDVYLFSTPSSYSASDLGMGWLHALLDHYGIDRWVVVADADELLIYSGSETICLQDLVRNFDRHGYQAMLTFLLDMYANGPICKAQYTRGSSFLDTCAYFDSDSYFYQLHGVSTKVPAIGGVRYRLFWKPYQRSSEPPYLPKIPLVKWSAGLKYKISTHRIDHIRCAPSTGALLHFKLFSDFVDRARTEAQRGEHWQGAQQYVAYAESLAANPLLNPTYEGSVRFENTTQLVKLGLMIDDSSALTAS